MASVSSSRISMNRLKSLYLKTAMELLEITGINGKIND
jgi:hypothetical protein